MKVSYKRIIFYSCILFLISTCNAKADCASDESCVTACGTGFTQSKTNTCLVNVPGMVSSPGVCCKADAKNNDGKCASGKGMCYVWNTSMEGSACDGTDEYKGQDTCPSGEVCCASKSAATTTTNTNNNNNANSSSSSSQPTTSSSTSAQTNPAVGTGYADIINNGLVPCGTSKYPAPCTLCHLIIGFHRVFTFLLGLLITATLLAIVGAGVFYMVSTGNKGMMDTAKQALTYALTAFALGLGSWLIVTMILTALGFNNAGNWWNFSCDATQSKGASSVANNVGTSGGTGTNTGTPNGNCGGITTTGNASGQCEKASTKLSSVLDCIKSRMAYEPSKEFGITDLIQVALRIKKAEAGSGVNISSLYRPQSGNSCHTGGRNSDCKGETNAADLTGNMGSAAEAAKACGADTVIYQAKAYAGGQVYTNASDHFDHVHISVNNAKCGCDYLK
jgi:hypothetical protein